jgi:hypothetical protein
MFQTTIKPSPVSTLTPGDTAITAVVANIFITSLSMMEGKLEAVLKNQSHRKIVKKLRVPVISGIISIIISEYN